MTYLLDTNVLSEATKKQPSTAVETWLKAQLAESLFISALTVGEIRCGILVLDSGAKKRKLLRWLTSVKAVFEDRILPVDTTVIERWAELQASARNAGQRMPLIDSLLAATALSHGLTLVTRNIADFEMAGVELLDPWK